MHNKKFKPAINIIALLRRLEKIFIKLVNKLQLFPVAKTGRPKVNIIKIFRGLFFMLIRGNIWRRFDRRYGSKSTAHRYMKEWTCLRVFQQLWKKTLNMIRKQGKQNFYLQIVDASNKAVENILQWGINIKASMQLK
jgi:transposase